MARFGKFCVVVCAILAFAPLCLAIAERREGRMQAAALSEFPISADPVQGAAVPSSSETVIASPSLRSQEKRDDDFGDDSGIMHFSDDSGNRDLAASSARSAGSSSGENPFRGPTPHRWDPEVYNQLAIRRVAHDIPSLLKKVGSVLPQYDRHALLDPVGLPLRHNSDDDDMSLLQVEEEERQRFSELSDQQRDAELIAKRHNLSNLKSTIALELQATTHLQERLKAHQKSFGLKSNVPKGRDKELDRLLKSTDELAELNPDLKEWADDATFNQNRKEIDGLLNYSEGLLSNLKSRY